jgi:uncharacterized protein YndB with AHSA1/START domain
MEDEIKQKELVIRREFNLSLQKLWQAWTEPEQVMQWWGPKGFTCPVCKIDFRVGGKYLFSMRGPEGKDNWSTGTYKEIIPMKKIVCTDSFSDKDGNVIHATEYGLPGNWPTELLVTLVFEDIGGKSKLTLTHSGVPEEMQRQNQNGWEESLDKLDAFLSSKQT